MSRQLGLIKVMFSSGVLFDTQEEHGIYVRDGLLTYQDYMSRKTNIPLKPGPCFELIKTMALINDRIGHPLFELRLQTKNAMTGPKDQMPSAIRIENSIHHWDLKIPQTCYKRGRNISIQDHREFQTDLLLTTDRQDAQNAINNNIADAVVQQKPLGAKYRYGSPLHFCFDFDAVIADCQSEAYYKRNGLDQYQLHESSQKANALGIGPHGPLLKKLSDLVLLYKERYQINLPIRTSILTSRGFEARLRISATMQAHQIEVDSICTLAGAKKEGFLASHKPSVFFDDQVIHFTRSSHHVPCGQVPYKHKRPNEPIYGL